MTLHTNKGKKRGERENSGGEVLYGEKEASSGGGRQRPRRTKANNERLSQEEATINAEKDDPIRNEEELCAAKTHPL